LLVPTDEIQHYFLDRSLEPRDVFELARKYNVSMQASARRIVRVFGKDRVSFSFWDCVQPKWVVARWWTGLQTFNSRSLTEKLEPLITEAMSSRKDLIRFWQLCTRKKLMQSHTTEVHVTPTRWGKNAVVCLREGTAKQSVTPSDQPESSFDRLSDKRPVQLSLF
jgi:hypothetical protein